MANFFDQFDGAAQPQGGNFFDQFDGSSDGAAKKRTAADIARDVGVTAVKGAVGLPQAFVGLADIPIGGRVGKALEEVGYRPDDAQKFLDEQYSQQTQDDKRYVQQADGFVDTLGRAIERPATIATAVGESLPSMIGGAGIARGVLKAAPKLAPVIAGAIGEGAIGAGSAASQIRGENDDGLLTAKQSAIATASGVGTGILGFAGGKLAQKFGLADVDTLLASGAGQASAKGFVKQVVGSGVSEGVFEELPQSMQEQMWQNYATGKPVMEGVGNAGAMGMLAGAAMGGVGGGYNALVGGKPGNQPPPAEQPALAAADALGTPGEMPAPVAQPTEAERALYTPKSLTALDRVAEIDAQLQATDPNDITTLDALLAQRETLEEAVPAVPYQSSIPDGLSERNAELMALIEEEQADLDRRVAELPRLSDGTVKVEGGTPISSIPSHQIAQRLTAAETPETRHVIATEMQRRGLEVPVLPPLTGEAGKAVAILQKQVEVADPFTEQHADLSARLTNTVAVDAQAAIDGGEMPAYRAKNGLVVTVSPSAQNPGKLQVTRYDEGKGVIGDSQYNSVEDAIRQEGISNYERMPAGEVDAVLSNAAKAEVEYQKLRAEVDAPAGRQPEVGADNAAVQFIKRGDFWNYSGDRAQEVAKALDLPVMKVGGVSTVGIPENARKQLADTLQAAGIPASFELPESTTNVRTTPRKRPASDSLIQAIINRGGINRSIMSDVGGDKGGRYQPGLFTNNGTADLSELAQLLFEEDGFHQINQNSDIGPARELEELIGQALGGERILNTDAMERDREAEMKERHKQEVIKLADEYGVSRTSNPRNIETLDRRVSEAIIAEISNAGGIAQDTRNEALAAGMTEEDVSAIEDAIAGDDEFNGRDQPRDAMVKMWRKITKTLKERINDPARSVAQDARGRPDQARDVAEAGNEEGREDARAEGRAADPEAGAAAERPALDLAGQTNEDIARQEQARKEAEEERQAEERRAAAAERQARIDAEVAARQSIAADNFSLDAQVNDRDAQRRADARRADDQLAGQGDIFGQAPAVQAKPEKVGADETPFIRKGDRFTDGQGKTWEVWSARSSLIEAFPVIDGKMRINNQDGQRWATDERARLANPEARTDFTPIQKEKRVVTPQIMTAAQFNSVIQIAADSVAKLRKDDVERVVSETPAPWRLDMAGRIKSARPDLAQEVDDAMSEVSLKVGAGETANTEMDALKAEMGQAIDELASLLGAKANLTPEEETKLIPIVSKMFRIAAKMGYIKFKEAAHYVLEQIRALAGNEIADKLSIDNLQAGYINIAKEIGGDKREAMAYDSIEEITQGDGNEPNQRSSTNLERDRRDAEAADELGAQGVRAGRDGDGRPGERGIPGAEGESRAGSGDGVSGREAAAAGERGNQQIYTGAPDVSTGTAGSRVDSGSDSAGLNGTPIEPNSTAFVEELAESGLSLAQAKREQAQADSKEHRPGLQNIRDTLPILTEGQQEDVFKAETRFAVPDGYGMLFTNGTGTGKTYLGLGVIKRHVTAGKDNIIVVVPNDKIAEDWQKSGTLLGLDIARLKDTNDAGRGVVITTYANFGQNQSLASRNWDLIVHDEGHYLAMDKDGTSTLSLKALKAISLHPEGAMARAKMLYADQYAEMNRLAADAKMDRMSDDERNWSRATATQAKADVIAKDLREKEKAVKEFIAANQGEKRPRALFLSATPFAYEKSVDWANGYLFDYNEGRASEEGEFRGYNTGSNREQFFMQHFGYRMRYGKLTAPDAKVDSGLMQRQFNTWLKKKGSLSGRMLDVKADYDRRFILTESAIGARIDEALQWFEQQRNATEDANRKSALFDVAQLLSEKFDYLSRRYLLEAIKAREVIPHVKEHLALGRKVVVFHDYKKGGGFNPFDLATVSKGDEAAASGDADAMNAIIDEFRDTFKDLIESNVFRASSPITAFQKAFPGVLLFNGNVSAKDRRANVAKFQDDASGPQVMLVQSAAGKEGISLHDTTGKHQRVLFNLGQPTQPTTAIQQEGRIYRTGQVTDAIFRYLNTGTNWEKWAFATTIANRASAAENLGMGEQARALKDAFITGFEESDDYRAGMEGEGKGGKERDRAANAALTEYDRARAFYFGTQKKTSKTKAQEGADYFATPEPIGLKMVEFADIRPGEAVLEPSAGHGAIARWIPDSAEKTAIEPSMTLRPRLAMGFDGKIVDTTFEDHHVSNKYDAIVLNPPFGSGGTTAIQHLAKAATHLRDGGRIVALIPRGPAADKKFDKWFYEGIERQSKPIYTHPGLGPIYENDTLEMAPSPLGGSGLKIAGPLSIDKVGGAYYVRPKGEFRTTGINLIALNKIVPGNRTETYKPAEGLHLVADIVMPNVTFERAGTQVATRIVVIEKSKDSPQQYSPSFTDVDDINTLFDRMEGLTLPARAKPVEEVKDTDTPKTARAKTEVARAAAIANEEKAKEAGAIVDDPAQATFALNAAGNKIITNAPTIKYTTKGGKELTGVLVADKAMAKAVDKFSWATRDWGGKFFVRIEHIERPVASEPKMSRGTGSGMALRDLQAVADRLAPHFKNMPRVHVLESPSGLSTKDPSQKALRDFIRKSDAWHDVEGATHDGEIYLFASGMADEARAEHVFATHEVTHYGLRGAVGKELDAGLQHILLHNAKVRKAAAAMKMARGLRSNVEAIEEVLADMPSAELAKLTGWRAVVKRVRNWLKKIGAEKLAARLDAWINAGLSEQQQADLFVAEMVTAAREWVRTGNGKADMSGTRLADPTLADDMARQEKWLAKEAKARGYQSIDELAEKAYPVFENLAALWRKKNPVEVAMLSRSGYAFDDGILDYATADQVIDGARLKELRRSAARLEKPRTGTFLQVTEDGRAIATGEKGTRIPETFIRFAQQNGLRFEARRIVPQYGNIPPANMNIGITKKSEPMPIEYRESGALYFGEGGASVDRTGKTRFSRAASPAPTSAPAHPPAPGNPWQAAKAKAAAILTPERIDRAIYEFQDKMIDLKRLRDHIKDIGGVINDLNDAYMGEELYHKRVAKRTEDFLAKEVKPLLADMRFRAISIEEMETYLHARHAPEANAEMAKRNPNQAEIDAGRKLAADEVKALELQLQAAQSNGGATKSIEQALNEARGKLSEWNGAQAFRGTEAERLSLSGMSDADAAKIMAGLAPGKRVHLTALAAKVDAMNAKTLDELEKYGLMDKASLDAWRNAYQHYVPLHRDEAHPDSASHPIGQGYSTKGDASKQRTGSNAKVTHILGHIAMQREAALTRGEKNHVMRRLYLMAKQNPLKDVWSIDKIPTIETIDKKTGFVKAIPDPLHKMRPNVLMLRIAGKDVAITMNENNPEAVRMAAALKNLDVDDLHYIIPTVAKATRWFASVNTQYNPIFGIVNFTRDIQAAMLQLSTTEIAGRQGEVFKDTMAIMKQVLKSGGRMPKAGQWGALFDEMQNVGGTTGYRDLFLNAEDRANSLLKELKSLERGKVSQAAHAVVEWLSDYNEAMENAVRLAAYKAAIDNGMTKERAASLAKNLTVNFNRKGRQTREIGALYAFFNAAVQGTTRMAQTLAGPAGKKIMAGGVAVGALSALMGMAMMGDGDDDEYAKIPEFIKKRALIFPVSKDSYIAIPMPLGFHFLPNIGRLAVEMFAYKDKTIGKQVVSMFSVMAEAFNPLGGSAPALQMAMPTVLDPFVALAENKDWTGKAIYLENYNNLDPEPGHRRTKDSATAWSKAFSEAINAITGGTQYTPGAWSPTPDQIDYVIGQLTGGVGREIGKLATSVQAPFTGDELPPHKLPLVGRFYGNTSGPSGQSEKFYENIKLANQHENEIVGRLKDGKPTDDYLKENPSARELAARGNVAEAQVRKLRSFRKEIARRDEPDAKNRKEEINHRIAAIMKGLNHEAERLR